MDFYVGIASYKRPEASRTLDYLDSLGFPKERRILSVQTEEDRDAYTRSGLSERVGTFLYREASTAAGNRNTVLLNVPEGTNVVFMDDDIKQVVMEDLGLVPLDTLEKFERMCKLGFATAQKNRTICFGLYPVANAYFMRGGYKKAAICVGTLIGMVATPGITFCEELQTKEDYELCCRIIRKYGACIRLDRFACDALHYSKGGCEDAWKDKSGVTLELLRYFDKIDYPLSFSTKAAWWTEDSRYMELFARHTHNWHVKISIITADPEKARKIERGVPSPQERLAVIKRLADIGIHVTLRLRPFIIGCSEDYPTLIRAAKEAGADSVTTEFFCMESRADDRLKARYAAMSEVLGYDIHQFYMENSKQQGYKRLNRAIKAPIIHRMRELTHSLGMRFHVSDAFCRECNDACNCCGVPPEWGVSQTGNIGNAIIIAREKGFVTFSDVMESINKYFDFPWVGACGYNTGSNKARALLYDTTMAQWLRSNWNDTKKGTSPARAYGGVLVPDGKDENGDVIYRYAIKR